jgi:hypothetical protein
MAGEEKVLSQADIDALLSKTPPKPAAPKPSAPSPPTATPLPLPVIPPEPVKPVEVVKPVAAAPRHVTSTASYQQYSSGETGNLQAMVADLARQVGKLTTAMQKLKEMEEKITQISALLKLSPNSTDNLKNRFDEITRRLDELQQNNTGIQEEFECRKCKSQQSVAVHVKCTKCGDESWMGWWPSPDQK